MKDRHQATTIDYGSDEDDGIFTRMIEGEESENVGGNVQLPSERAAASSSSRASMGMGDEENETINWNDFQSFQFDNDNDEMEDEVLFLSAHSRAGMDYNEPMASVAAATTATATTTTTIGGGSEGSLNFMEAENMLRYDRPSEGFGGEPLGGQENSMQLDFMNASVGEGKMADFGFSTSSIDPFAPSNAKDTTQPLQQEYSTKTIRFAPVLATQIGYSNEMQKQSEHSLGTTDLFANDDSLCTSDVLMGNDSFANAENSKESFQDEDEKDIKDDDEESVDEDTKLKRQLMMTAAGVGFMALFGWGLGKIRQIFEKNDEADVAGDVIQGVNHATNTVPVADPQLLVAEAMQASADTANASIANASQSQTFYAGFGFGNNGLSSAQ